MTNSIIADYKELEHCAYRLEEIAHTIPDLVKSAENQLREYGSDHKDSNYFDLVETLQNRYKELANSKEQLLETAQHLRKLASILKSYIHMTF